MQERNIATFLKENKIQFVENAELKKLVSIGVGGNADFLIIPKSIDELCKAILYFEKQRYKYYILGNGTNVYFSDEGYSGAIISTLSLNSVKTGSKSLIAECGTLLTHLSCIACDNSLSGLEFAYGIPGSIGGAVYMNASAFGSQISDIVLKSTVLERKTGNVFDISKEEHLFSEKESIFAKNNDFIILSTEFSLNLGTRDEIRRIMDEYMSRRRISQPLDKKSAGSTFKRPKGHYASKLIDDAGLKGLQIGDAQVSMKHAGFVINISNASSNEIKSLMNLIKDKVFKQFQVMLEEEIIYVE